MKFKFHKFKFNQFKWKGTGIAFHVLLIAAAFLITAAAVVTGAYVETGYQVSVGVISPQRFKATRKVENTLATEQNRAEAEKAALDMKPLRKKDPTINEKAAARLEALFISLDDIRRLYTNERLEEELEDGVPPPGFAPVTESGAPLMPLTALEQLDTLQLTLSETQSRLLLEMDAEHYDKIKETIPLVLETVFDQGVQEVDAKSLLNMQDEFAKIDMNGDMQNMGYQIASSYLEPNYIVDEAATAKARQEIAGQYQQVFLLKDQMIVDKDEPIDEEAYQILEALGFISYGLRDKIVPAVNAVAVLGILYALSILYLITYHKNMFAHKKEAALLFTIYSAVIICLRLLIGVPYLLTPIFIFTMLTAMLIDARLSVVLNLFVTITGMLILKGGVDFFIFYTTGGLAVAMLAKYTQQRNHVFIVGILTSAVESALMFALTFFLQRTYTPIVLLDAGYAALNGIFTVIVSVGSLPFWEGFFGVVTNLKLLDLTNPASPLLRRLIIEAPGTYQHSLIVANLAETAAYDIGADAILARVGGYYHDIGKLKFPQYFVENLIGENPHNFMIPHDSAEIIIEHVKYGLELADQQKLPRVIKDIIQQHHGTTLIQFFYRKEQDACGDMKKVEEADFRYPFESPRFRESGIVMLADTVEAAVRSMINRVKSIDEVEPMIRKLIKGKLDDGQLLHSQFSIQDVEDIAQSFTRFFKGMYHERIAYPKPEERMALKEAASGTVD